MVRPLRLEFPEAVYHVTSRGNARQDIFLDDSDRERFLSILSSTVHRYNWLCHAYCLMDNHYHLLLETPDPKTLQKPWGQVLKYKFHQVIVAPLWHVLYDWNFPKLFTM